MPITMPLPSGPFLGTIVAPWPFVLPGLALVAVIGAALVVVAVLRSARRETEHAAIVTRPPTAVRLPEAA